MLRTTHPIASHSLLYSLQRDERVRRAFQHIRQAAERMTQEHISICEIPAPPFQEQVRGQYFARRFSELGLQDVQTDRVGNVIGFMYGEAEAPLLAVSAHLDTVFPAATDVLVKKSGTQLCAPGIGDNAAGLAALLAMIEMLNATQIKPRGSLVFVATVGEEGQGNLRGARYLFTEGNLAGRITEFISFDGPGADYITHQALGSRRYRITLTGPGGHSWSDFGVVNPVHALGRVITNLAEYPVPGTPRTTYNVGRIESGDAVNVIPESATMDIDLRSTDEGRLSQLEEFLLQEVHRAVHLENVRGSAAGRNLRTDIRLLGYRPSGETPYALPLVKFAFEASKLVGLKPVLNCASTDANIPISLGIPAITLGSGGKGGNAHRLNEWYDPAGRETGYQRALLLILTMVGVS